MKFHSKLLLFLLAIFFFALAYIYGVRSLITGVTYIVDTGVRGVRNAKIIPISGIVPFVVGLNIVTFSSIATFLYTWGKSEFGYDITNLKFLSKIITDKTQFKFKIISLIAIISSIIMGLLPLYLKLYGIILP